MRKIGIMGGTFDPIHIGHLLLAQGAQELAGLDEIRFLPAGMPYKKADREILPAQERLHMVELALAECPGMICMDLEIRRAGYTYTYETLEELSRLYPADTFYFIMGADCLFSIEYWKRPELILKYATLIAALRDTVSEGEAQEKAKELEGRFGGRILMLKMPRLDISSTEIRNRIAEGKSIRYLVPEPVRIYIEEREFYRG